MRFSLVVVAQRHRRNLDFGLKYCSAYGDLAILWEETKWTNLTKKHSIKENKVSIWNFFSKKYFKKQIFVLKSWSFKDIASFTIYKLKECLPYPFNSSMSNFLKFGMFSWDLYAKIYVLWSRGQKKMFVCWFWIFRSSANQTENSCTLRLKDINFKASAPLWSKIKRSYVYM